MSESIPRLNAALSGRYTIEREIGEGGMATVYLARDLKHNRKVALKVLKPELVAVLGAERFLQEIETTASLQHPHILPLFDSGKVDGSLFYVMPFIDGETLREKLDRERQLGIEEAVRITTEVADALDYAHRHDVIHRDIKPANILLHDGRPMVADFGIALALSAAAGGRMTETGMSLGTPHYMSPEQATAEKELTGRSDVYSLGAVLYEMLTGEPPHLGNSTQQIILKIVTDEARPVTELRKSVPPNVAAATAQALERLAADRFASAEAMAQALADPAFRGREMGATVKAAGTFNRLTAAFATLALLFALAFGWSMLVEEPAVPGPVARFRLDIEKAGGPFLGTLAPDGSFTVFVAPGPDGRPQLWRRRWEDLEATPIPGTEGAAEAHVVSPDGREVAYSEVMPGPLLVTSVDGGPTRTVAEFQWGAFAWSTDGMLYFTNSTGAGIGAEVSRVGASGGSEEAITELLDGELAHGLGELLPSGRTLLFTVWHALDGSDAEIWAIDLESRERKRLTPGLKPSYAPTGHLVFGTAGGSLMAAPFDADAVELTGPAVPIIQGLQVADFLGLPGYELSESGTLRYQTSGTLEVPVWVDRRSGAREVMMEWVGVQEPAISPDGGRVAVSRDGDIVVLRTDGGPATRLTFGEGRNVRPTWSADGRTVLFLSDRAASVTGHNDVFSTRADGSGEVGLVFDAERGLIDARWSSDGEWLLVTTSFEGPTSSDILGVRLGTDAAPVPLITSRFTDYGPALSPDGRWLAYSSEGGLFVVPFPATDDARWLVAGEGSAHPVWSSEGTELLYMVQDAASGSATVFSAKVVAGAEFSVVETQEISTYLAGFTPTSVYAVTPDDQRLLIIQTVGFEESEVVLVQNFYTELLQIFGN